MTRFVLRRPGASTTPVEFDRRAAALIPEALRHVASSVFESEHDERHHLRDAAEAVRRALDECVGRTVKVGFTDPEGEHVPEALRHVGREVFGRDDPKGDLLQEASRIVAEAFPKALVPGR